TAGFDSTEADLKREVRVWDVGTGRVVAEFRPRGVPYKLRGQKLYGVVGLSPDGETVAFDDYAVEGQLPEVRVVVYDLKRGRERYRLAGHDQLLSCVRFSASGRLLATAVRAGDVLVHDLTTGRPLHARALQGHPHSLGDL